MIEYTCGKCTDDMEQILKKIAAYQAYLKTVKNNIQPNIIYFDSDITRYSIQVELLEKITNQFSELFENELKDHA